MSTFSQWLILFRVHAKMLRVKAVAAVTRSSLMTLTITAFLLAYAFAGYWLFSEGLEFVANLPAAGALLSDRLIHLMFFCFMLMLIFSVAVTGYISLYRSRDTAWLLTLPVSHRAIFLWKCFESAVFSSWGLVFILAPLLAAFARIRDVGPEFFFKTAFVLVPFLVVASTIGALLLVAAVRWLSRRQLVVGAALVALVLVASAVRTALEGREIVNDSGLSAALTFQQVLSHTNIAVNRAVPSTWLSGSIVDWTRPYRHFGNLLYPTLLVANSLMGLLLAGWAGQRWFYASWNRSIQHSADAAIRQSGRKATTAEQMERDFPAPSAFAWLVGRPIAAISRKDFLTFFREPAQWVQFMLVFGLLAIYSSGLRRMNGNLDQPRDLFLVAFLNLAVCALALSTLTTRFVFPQFSLEGRRLWILAMSPLKLPSIVTQKFVGSTFCSGVIVMVILLIGGFNLQLGLADSLFFAAAIGMLAVGLNALAVGLGVIFPNLEEANAAKIVSGFGGTLCLVGSFIYILVFTLLLVYARWEIFESNRLDPRWYLQPQSRVGLSAIVALTILVTTLPLFFSRKKLKRLEILADL
ncbi:MAG: hypothetical protein WD342_17000 [Verrucomicrobiales bacterium]